MTNKRFLLFLRICGGNSATTSTNQVTSFFNCSRCEDHIRKALFQSRNQCSRLHFPASVLVSYQERDLHLRGAKPFIYHALD